MSKPVGIEKIARDSVEAFIKEHTQTWHKINSKLSPNELELKVFQVALIAISDKDLQLSSKALADAWAAKLTSLRKKFHNKMTEADKTAYAAAKAKCHEVRNRTLAPKEPHESKSNGKP